LFLPTVKFSPNGSSLAYWGEQTYHFHITDEWGPNSEDPSQNKSVRLIGKPIWYVYVEEYWRRFYVQPWDMVDETCDLPLNQEITYTQRDLDGYCHECIANVSKWGRTIDMHKSYIFKYVNGVKTILTELTDFQLDGQDGFDVSGYTYQQEEHSGMDAEDTPYLGFNDFVRYHMRKNAREIFIQKPVYKVLFTQWVARNYLFDYITVDESGDITPKTQYVNINTINSYIDSHHYFLHGTFIETSSGIVLNDPIPDKAVIQFLYAIETVSETIKEAGKEDRVVETEVQYIRDFNEFYVNNMQAYDNYVDSQTMLDEYMSINNIQMKDGSKLSTDGTVLVPDDNTLGHVGIRFDASKPCHTLGPFMEGGEFYFFNTVVNRTMPCEYWLDKEMRTRQYFIKQKWTPTTDTNGGQTWTFDGDKTHFKWVPNLFSDAQKMLKDEYTEDRGSNYFPIRRLPNIYNEENYNCRGMNAKRLKSDGRGGEPSNDIVPQDKYQVSAQTKQRQPDPTAPRHVTYTETDITIEPLEEATEIQPHVNEVKHLEWEYGGWTGWYEKNEMVKCVTDGKWYRRAWSPINYTKDSPLWNRTKRQQFPNPSPWLCDNANNPYSQEMKGRLKALQHVKSTWCTNMVYDNDEANRIHLLHWEYALYFNLTRQYPRDFNFAEDDGASLRRHFFLFSTPSTNPVNNVLFVKVKISDGTYTPPIPTNGYDDGDTNYYINGQQVLDKIPFGEIPADIETLMEEYAEQNGAITSIETENAVFENWLSSLGSAFFMLYEDRDIRWHYLNESHTQKREITQADIRNGNMYVANVTHDGTEVLAPLPEPEFTVSYGSRTEYGEDESQLYYWQSYLTFNDFKNIWEPLTQEQITALRLNGDVPQRNEEPYYMPDNIYPETTNESDSSEETTYKRNALKALEEHLEDEQSPSLLTTEFFPRIDTIIRAENERRKNQPQFTVSPLDELETDSPSGKSLSAIISSGAPLDPYRNGTVNPIETWKKYFDHREEFTIPEETTAGGDGGNQSNIYVQTDEMNSSTITLGTQMLNPKGSQNYPSVHPRETSFHHEDGARRHYPDDMFVSPVLEYQKIIRRDYGRLPGKDDEEAFLQQNWKTDKAGNWGDGFDITVTIPWKEHGEVQSPFSEADNVTQPIGTYCHNCVKPEDKMRYHLEWYDSLDQIRKYDFPNYVNIIHAFQKECMPTSYTPPQPPDGQQANESSTYQFTDENNNTYTADITDFTQSLYKEDFNDYKKTKTLRATELKSNNGVYNLPELAQYNAQRLAENPNAKTYSKWQEALDDYWIRINGNDVTPHQNIYIDRPVVRGYDCKGNQVEENAFERLEDGSIMWREQTTNLLPTIEMQTSENRVGKYTDSKGNIVKGGGLVTFNDPYKDHHDGKWYEECLGAIVRARCVLILEDALGYRWQQVVEATALQPDQPIRGKDYVE
jgi:hypothetical protein